jgi:hypothetical protein
VGEEVTSQLLQRFLQMNFRSGAGIFLCASEQPTRACKNETKYQRCTAQ